MGGPVFHELTFDRFETHLNHTRALRVLLPIKIKILLHTGRGTRWETKNIFFLGVVRISFDEASASFTQKYKGFYIKKTGFIFNNFEKYMRIGISW